MSNRIGGYLARYKIAGAILYAALLIVFLATTALAVMDTADRQQAVAATAETLNELERRTGPPAKTADADASPISGSPFLEDATVTVAGATLLQRLAGAVTRVGGTIVSSQVDLQGPLSKERFISATASCELQQPALQQLLYDLESGMPFLYVEHLQVEAPAAVSGNPGGPLRVSISVSAQWQGSR